jgi:transcriptional regulator with XRE-family HTH domain
MGMSRENKKKSSTRMYDLSVLRDLRKRAGLTLEEIYRRSGIAPAVLSRIERNRALPGMGTLYQLARVFSMTATDLLALAEQRSSHLTREERYRRSGFSFRKITYGNVTLFHATATAGTRLTHPEVHHNEYEICWVIKGGVTIFLPSETHPLKAGSSIQFDAVLEHTYEVTEDCELWIVHVRKGMRF